MPLFLVLHTSSLFSSESLASLPAFGDLLGNALLEVQGSFEALRCFKNHEKKSIQDVALKEVVIIFGHQTNLGLILSLDSRLFAKKAIILTMLFPLLKLRSHDENKKIEEVIVDYSIECLVGHMPFELFEFAYRKKPICVDHEMYGRLAGLLYTIGDVIDCDEERFSQIGGSLVNREKIKELVASNRDKDAKQPIKSYVLDCGHFSDVIEDALLSEKKLGNLELYLHGNPELLNHVKDIVVAFQTLPTYIASKNPLLYNRTLVLEALGIVLDNDPWIACDEIEIQKLAGEEVAAVFRKALLRDPTPLTVQKAKCLYKKYPISIDEFPFDEHRNIGQALDDDRNLLNRRIIGLITRERRHKKPKELCILFIQALQNPHNEELADTFDEYLSSHYSSNDESIVCFSGGYTCTYESFMKSFINGILFPHFGEPEDGLDKERDTKILQTLWALAIENEEILPLVLSAQSHFIKAYKGIVDIHSLPYKDGKTIGEYLQNKNDL